MQLFYRLWCHAFISIQHQKKIWISTLLGMCLGTALSILLTILSDQALQQSLRPLLQMPQGFSIVQWDSKVEQFEQYWRSSESVQPWGAYTEQQKLVGQWPKESSDTACVLSITPSIKNILSLEIQKGRWNINENEIILGASLEHRWHAFEKTLFWDHQFYEVVGILKTWPLQPILNLDINECILLSMPENDGQRWDALLVQGDPEQLMQKMKALFSSHQEFEGIFIKHTHQWIQQEKMRIQQLQKNFTWIPWLIWCLSGLGMMNVQWLLQQQRRQELAIRLAVGAQPWQLAMEIFLEAFIQSILAATLGVFLGGLFGCAYSVLMETECIYWSNSWLSSWFWTVCIGIIFGAIPAQCIFQLDVIHILKSS